MRRSPLHQVPSSRGTASLTASASTPATTSRSLSELAIRSEEQPSPPPVTVHSIEKGEVFSPLSGELVSLKDLPDPTFAEEMTGKE